MTRYLCIDTSVGSAVALVEDRTVVARDYSGDPRAHAEHLAGLVRTVCAVSAGEGLAGTFDAVVVGRGPAPYTGLRAGLVTARVAAYASSVPVYGVSSLEIVGRCALDQLAVDRVMVCTDARRKEVYAAEIVARGDDDVAVVGEHVVDTPEAIAQRAQAAGLTVAGPGAVLYADIFGSVSEVNMDVAVAARITQARIAAGEAPVNTEPLYLRRPDVQVSAAVAAHMGNSR